MIFDVHPDGFSLPALGLSVWIIYSVDHLLDARKIPTSALTFRHQFYKRNFRVLGVSVAIVVLLTTVGIILFLKKPTLVSGGVIAGIALLYLIFQQRLSYGKELMGSLLYTSGILVPVLSRPGLELKSGLLFIVFQFFLVVLLNLILFASFDKKNDLSQQQESIATEFSTATINRLFWICFSFALMVAMLNFYLSPQLWAAIGIILMMTIVLGMIHHKRNLFSLHDRFRYVGDAIFFLPLLYIIFK
jgi:4-hydroxybenzoate polyprenyltransferase